MKVHIVCKTGREHVLGRLGHALAEQTGWTLSNVPNRRADLNYFLPYLNVEPVPTASAAYFSHLETADGAKRAAWYRANAQVDVRVVTARRYLDDLSNVKVVARLPVDPQFTPKWTPLTAGRLRVGVAGMTYTATGRKGEALLEAFRGSAVGKSLQLVTTGRGWSPDTTMLDWGQMPDFYRSLDIYLCTSLVEGGPLPPLEALACGVQVIIPAGVGMLDDLPDMMGVYRYKAGDVADMIGVLETVASAPRANENGWGLVSSYLASLVEDYSAQHWAADHVKAFVGATALKGAK